MQERYERTEDLHEDERGALRTAAVHEAATDTVIDEHTHDVVTDPYAGRRGMILKVNQWIYLVAGVLEGLIAIRFALRLLSANPDAAFTAFIYNVSEPFVVPFAGIFPSFRSEGSVFEPHAILAIVMYALLAWLLTRIVWLAWGETRSGGHSSTTRTRSRG